jgi:sigma-B regulation protein RsbU (phosphoserine phosphatase)
LNEHEPTSSLPADGTEPVSLADVSHAGDPDHPSAPPLSLVDFLDLETLQEIQDSFTAVTRLKASIRDRRGQPVTRQTDPKQRAKSDELLTQLISTERDEHGRFIAPIMVEGQQLGSITLDPDPLPQRVNAESRQQFRAAAERLKLSEQQTDELLKTAEQMVANPGASIQFLYLMANSIARLCYEQYHARQRVEELSALYRISTLLSVHRDLDEVLDTATRSIAEVVDVKAVSIRLIENDGNELIPQAVYNLSQQYLNKGAVKVDQSELFVRAVGEGEVMYIEDMRTDSRVLYPEEANREGLVSMLLAGMRYKDKAIGTLQLYAGQRRRFSDYEVHLVQAISQLLATAIENTRLDEQRLENQSMIRQLQLAADVQRRMLPTKMPNLPPFDVAARYVPSYELGGDFYDFIDLDGHLGIGVGDVVGKGIAASLLMASVRASLRAYAQDVYDLDDIIHRVNHALSRDTLDNEFATLWYGVFDPTTMRLTYCNAGHEPPLLLRDGQLHELSAGGMLLGIDQGQLYDKGLFDLKAGDLILLYSDGLPDALNDQEERFGRERVKALLPDIADKSANDALSYVLWQLRRFTGLRRSVDDTTLVVVTVDEHEQVQTAQTTQNGSQATDQAGENR